jgi:CheY-like chemotaxis protein
MARILLVDDDPMIRTTLPLALGEQGHEALGAGDGRQALRLLRQQRIDLVLTDVLMPDVDGLEVVRAVRKEFPGTPVVAMSGGSARLPGHDALQLATHLGAHAVLEKPFTEQQLRETIDKALAEPRR